jgi:uncharacterized protein (DUF983 family)
MSERDSQFSAWTFIGRALRLRCPECGISPIFRPLRQTRSLFDWFTPLDGCPRCGYAYQREQGYFLLSIWALNYGLIAGLALLISFTLDMLFDLSLWTQIVCVFAPMPLFSFLFSRHSKALFLALDHYCDPHVRSDQPDDDHPTPAQSVSGGRHPGRHPG